MDWFSILGLLLITLIIIYVVLKIMNLIKIMQQNAKDVEEVEHAMKYNTYSARKKFDKKEYDEIILTGVSYAVGYERIQTLYLENEITEKDVDNVMGYLGSKVIEVGQK